MTVVISILILFLISFLTWHFLLSIYEVKYLYELPSEKLKLNTKYKIEGVGLNSLGWEITYRDLGINYKIENGKELIEIQESNQKNQFTFRTNKAGNITIIAYSKFSLNPTQINFTITDKLDH